MNGNEFWGQNALVKTLWLLLIGVILILYLPTISVLYFGSHKVGITVKKNPV